MLYINAYSGKAVCFAIKMCVESRKKPKKPARMKGRRMKTVAGIKQRK